MGLFSTSRSDVERALKNLRERLGHSEYRASVLETLKSFAREKSEFRNLVIDNMQGLIIETAGQNSNAVGDLVKTAFTIAGEDGTLKTNLIQKVVLAYPSFLGQVRNNGSILPAVIDEGIAASKSSQNNKLFFLMKTCDILAPIAAIRPDMVQIIVPRLLLAAENDVSLPQDLIPGYYDDDDASNKDPDKKQNMTLRSYIVRKTVDLLPALSIQNSNVAKEIVKSMLFSTAYDPTLKNLIMRKTSHTLPALAQGNMPAAYELMQNMLTLSMTDDEAKAAILKKGIEIMGVAVLTDSNTTRSLLQYMLTAAGAGAMKAPVLEKSCDILPALAANDGSSAFALTQTMLAAAGDDAAIRARIVNTACDFLPAMAARDAALAMTLVQSLMTAAAGDKTLKSAVISRAADALPSFIKSDSSRAYILLQNMMTVAADDADTLRNVAGKARDMIPALAASSPSGMGEVFARVLPSVQDGDLRSSIVNKAFFGLTASVTDDDAARNLYIKMSGVIADDMTLRRTFIEKTTDSFISLAGKSMNNLKDGMVSNLLTTTAAEPELASLFISKTLAVLPVIATKDAGFTYKLADNLLKAANGAQDTQKAILETATAALPSVAALSADIAKSLNTLLTRTAGEGASLKKAFTESAAGILPDIVANNADLTMNVFRSAISVAGNDNDLKVPVLEKACDLLPLVAAKTDWPTLSLISGIMQGAGIDTARPAVYKEFAVAPSNPRSNTRTIILHRGDAVDRTVILADKNYLSAQFETVVRGTSDYLNYAAVKEHYRRIFNFMSHAETEMNKSISLKQVVRDKLLPGNGNSQQKQPSAWPGA